MAAAGIVTGTWQPSLRPPLSTLPMRLLLRATAFHGLSSEDAQSAAGEQGTLYGERVGDGKGERESVAPNRVRGWRPRNPEHRTRSGDPGQAAARLTLTPCLRAGKSRFPLFSATISIDARINATCVADIYSNLGSIQEVRNMAGFGLFRYLMRNYD